MLGVPTEPEAALVQQPVMRGAEQNEVLLTRRASVDPMLHVVDVGEAGAASGKAAPTIASLERSPEPSGHSPRAAPDVADIAVAPVRHRLDRRVAREAPRRFRGNAGPVFELGAARVFVHPEGRRIHVEDDQVAVGAAASATVVR